MTMSPSGTPTSGPTIAQTIPATCDASKALAFHIEFRLDANGGSEFGWKLLNKKVETSGWTSIENGNHPTDKTLSYTVCLPLEECWVLSLSDPGSKGLGNNGYYKGFLDGKEILSNGDGFLGSAQHEICVGEEGYHCTDVENKFIYKRTKRNGRTKRGRTSCEELGNNKKTKSRTRNRICKAGYKNTGSLVKQRCIKTCGEANKGKCKFLSTYGDAELSPYAPSSVTPITFDTFDVLV